MTTNTNTAPADIYDLSLKALTEYLKDCDEHAIEPDVGSAFANAFRAGAALSTAAQQPTPGETLTDAQIEEIYWTDPDRRTFSSFARAIEAAHGITARKEQA